MGSLAASPYQIDPETGLPIDPQTGQPIQSDAVNPLAAPRQQASPGSIYGSPQNAVIPNTIADPEAPMQNRYTQNQNIVNALGSQINNEAQYQMGYYGGLVPQYQSQIDQQLSQLQQTPGYTPDEASKIGIDYGQYRSSPEELAAIQGNPLAAQQKAEQGSAGEGAMLNAYQQNLGGQVGNYGAGVGGAVDQYGSGVGSAAGGLKSGLDKSQNFGMLNDAVNSEGLNFDPNQTEKQLTDADVQQMKTSAGTRIGNQYRNAEDTLERQAAEAGNSSPLAIEAARSRLMHQESADQGDAEVNADIAAKKAQYDRAAGIEGQRLGSEQTKSGMRAAAGTTEQSQGQAAAGLAGTAGLAAAQNVGAARLKGAEDIGQTGINAANQYGTTSIATQGDIANRDTAAAAAADKAASDRASQTAGMRYGQGVQTGQATSQGAQTTGGARIAGEGALRAGTQGQEGWAQTGGNQAATQQNQAYGTQTNGLNQSTSGQGSFINGKASFGDSLASGFAKGLTGLLSPGGAKGDIVTEPQTRWLGEKGPEIVIPLGGRYRKQEDCGGGM